MTSEPEPDAASMMGREGKNVDVTEAKLHIENAVAALRDNKLDEARAELDRAQPFADELKREEIRSVRQSVDEAEANRSIPAIVKLAQGGQCEKAIDKSVKVIDTRRDTTIPVFMVRGTSAPILACLLNQLAVDLSIGREIAANDATKRALAKTDFQTLTTEVTDATVKELIGRFEEPIAARDWETAKGLLDELYERKEAGDNEYNRIMGILRDGIAKDVKEKVSEGLDDDDDDAREKLDEVDKLIAAAAWGTKQGSSVGAVAMPDGVEKARRDLALWVACKSVKCTLSAARAIWAYGDVVVKPMLNPRDGASTRTIEHGTKLWRVAESSSWVLVTDKDPGALDDVTARANVAAGWIELKGTRLEDTGEMLPPGDSIVGTRVWGPLREGQKDWELGTVVRVDKSNIVVERIADFAEVTVARSAVRYGTVSEGTKVLARCNHPLNLEEAVIDKVVFPSKGDAVATLTCLDSKGGRTELTRKEQLGALRGKPAWLPARR